MHKTPFGVEHFYFLGWISFDHLKQKLFDTMYLLINFNS
jgi:hypothetical protein